MDGQGLQYGVEEVGEGSLGPAPRTATAATPPLGYKFSPDELRVMAECNRESFYKRSLPFGSMLGLGTFSLIQSGYLRANPRFGAMPKVSLAVVVGYFLGKLSYQQACAEKLMALPGSYIGQLLRERRDGVPSVGRAPPTMFGAGPGDIYSDAGPGSALDLNTDRPSFDNAHPPPAAPHPTPTPQHKSYDELRQRNRTDLYRPADPYREDPSLVPSVRRAAPDPSGAPAPPAPPGPAGPPGPPGPSSPSRRVNQYGDEMD